jgi:hypothetical protein
VIPITEVGLQVFMLFIVASYHGHPGDHGHSPHPAGGFPGGVGFVGFSHGHPSAVGFARHGSKGQPAKLKFIPIHNTIKKLNIVFFMK